MYHSRDIADLRADVRANCVIFLNLCWYCIAVLVLTAHEKVVPDSLTVAWFPARTAERGMLAGIKIKVKDE